MSDRVSLDELLEIANKVRAAGGGNPLDALMPAIPTDSSQCLIARNMNFNCEVNTESSTKDWAMILDNKDVRDKIAEALGWEADVKSDCDLMERYAVILPANVGAVALEFDEIYEEAKGRYDEPYITKSDLAPYIEQAVRETQQIGYINEEGKLVL